jgi:hypothetical protein
VPVATAGLADVGAADPHPRVAGRVGDQRDEKLLVGGLDRGAGGERLARLCDPVGERVADQLELTEVEHPRHSGGGDPVRDLDPSQPFEHEPAELPIEPPDLPAQLGARPPLVDRLDACRPLGDNGQRPRLPFEQIRHTQSLSRLEGRGGNP